MLVTEEQARERWCPFVRVALAETIAGNRMDVTDGESPIPEFGSQCIASDCMAWRWSDWRKEEIPAGGYDQQETEKLTKMGFCGLAGKPA